MSAVTSPTGGLRRMRSVVRMFVFLLTLFSAAAVSAKEATFLMTSGERYNNVSYRVLRNYRAVEIQVDDRKINLSYTDIAVIYDRNGNDITRETIGRNSRTSEEFSDETNQQLKQQSSSTTQPKESWESKDDFGYRESQKSSWLAVVSLGGNFAVPIGDYYEGISAGIGFGGEAIFPVAKDVGIGGIVSYNSLPTDFEGYNVSCWKYMFMLSYLAETNEHKNLFYVSVGVGATTLSLLGYSETNFTLPSRIGIVIPLGTSTGFNIGGGYDLSFVSGVDQYGNDATSSAFQLTLQAGLSFAGRRKN